MTRQIHKSKALTVTMEDDILIHDWQNMSDFTVRDYQTVLPIALSCIKKEKPKSVLWKQTNFSYQIPPAIYEWFEEIKNKVHEIGVKNIAFYVSPNLLDQLCIMLSIEQETDPTNYFTDLRLATDFVKQELD